MWNTTTKVDFDQWFAGLESEEKVQVAAHIKVLERFGPMLGRPYVDHLKGSRHSNMKELRLDLKDKVIRIAFAFDPTRTAVLLVAGDKAGISQQLFYQRLITRADAVYDVHLKELANKGNNKKTGPKKKR